MGAIRQWRSTDGAPETRKVCLAIFLPRKVMPATVGIRHTVLNGRCSWREKRMLRTRSHKNDSVSRHLLRNQRIQPLVLLVVDLWAS